MSYLARETASLPPELWSRLDSAVTKTARQVLVSRRFLHLFGPLGVGATTVPIDTADELSETAKDGLLTTAGRKFVEVPTIYEDFTLLGKDLETAARADVPVDVSRAAAAAEQVALKEDKLALLGDASRGYDGLLTAPGVNKAKRGDWSEGENAFKDVASAQATLAKAGVYGPYALVLSPDLFAGLHRIQQGTGVLEVDRVRALLGGHVYQTPVLAAGQAALLATSERNMDLAVGQDLATAYLELTGLNHVFRVLETAVPRLKRPSAVVVFE
jgi:uncharacterized linocin/CFP29 family protein